MTTRFWIGTAVGAAVAWFFFAPRGAGANGVGGAAPRKAGPAPGGGFASRWRR